MPLTKSFSVVTRGFVGVFLSKYRMYILSILFLLYKRDGSNCNTIPSQLVLEYYCWYTSNILTKSIFDALSIGSGLGAADSLCMNNHYRFSVGTSREKDCYNSSYL